MGYNYSNCKFQIHQTVKIISGQYKGNVYRIKSVMQVHERADKTKSFADNSEYVVAGYVYNLESLNWLKRFFYIDSITANEKDLEAL